MHIQPYMIDVEYDEQLDKLENNRLPIVQITKADALPYDAERECWYTYNHFRREIVRTTGRSIRMLQIGFSIEQVENDNLEVCLSSLDGSKEKISLEYDKKTNIWFERLLFKVTENKKTKEKRLNWLNRITGLSNAGLTQLIITQNSRIIYKGKISFLPSSISVDDYHVMINDLFRINEALIQSKNPISVGNKRETRAERLKQLIEQLKNPIQAINHQPQATLSFKWVKGKDERSAKFRLRTELEKRMSPGKQQINLFKAYETPQIKENEMIKSELLRVKDYCEFHSVNSPLVATDLKQIDAEINANIAKSNPTFQRRLKAYNIIDKNGKIHINPLKKLRDDLQSEGEQNKKMMEHLLNEQINKLKQSPKRWGNNGAVVEVMLKLRLNNTQFKREVNFAYDLTSTYQAFRDKQTGVVPFQFLGYEYTVDNRTFQIDNRYSQFATITLRTNDITNHAKLAEIFEQATDLHNQSSLEIKVKGTMSYPKNIHFNDGDIIGKPSTDSYRYYEFAFTGIDSGFLDGKEVALSINKQKAYEDISQYILMKTNPRYRRLEAENETVYHDLHGVNYLINLLNSTEQQTGMAELYGQIAKTIDEWLQLPVFRSIRVTGLERLQPTQLFLHDPTYLIVWNTLLNIEETCDLTIIPRIGELRLGVKRVDEIFETWILYKMVYLLTEEMGWKIESDVRIVHDYFLQFISLSKRRDLQSFSITLSLKDWKMEIFYEPKIPIINRDSQDYLTPDYVFKIFYKNKVKGVAYMDAKYRDYIKQGVYTWKNDIDEIAIEKYGLIQPADESWKIRVLTSFIIHSDEEFGRGRELTGENYHVYYNRNYYPNKMTGTSVDVHKYGSIYLLPTITYAFKNWFRMLMEIRLNEYRICWHCGSNDVDEETKFTRSNYLKYYYTCNDCHQFWVKTHCQKGHTFIKRRNTYHKLVERGNHWHVQCPTCGDELENRDNLVYGRPFVPGSKTKAISIWEEL